MENANLTAVDTEIPITLRLPFLGLRKCGLFTTNVFKRYSLMTVAALYLLILIIITMMQFTNIEKEVVVAFARNLEGLGSYMQSLGKVCVTTYHINDFTRLMELTKLFWKPNMCNQHTERKLTFMYTAVFQMQRIFLLILFMAGLLLMLVPFLEKIPALGIWTFEGHEGFYRFVIIQQLIYIPCSGFFAWCLDCMYLGFCIEIIVQFNILCQYLEEMAAEGDSFKELEINYLNKTRTCIRHHELLIRFIKEFRQTFSLILLVEYVTVGPVICAELFAAFEGHSFQNQIRHAIAFVVLTTQLSFYCIPANYIADKALAISDAIYFSNWYSHYFPSLKVPLLLMIQNAQNGIIINAGGLITINAQTVLNVLKVAWSACSIMRRLRHN